ncbi:helix-turn-helix domain-containing protein [Alicyclobacillus fodiniaquatilis]|uniref:Helix-turn-helix domain-containing protein n=1 Tax=Alicyclobacillus fodiniaquatilis TaxID=1661150 RepID=A0ABW4JIJ2_9BACL
MQRIGDMEFEITPRLEHWRHKRGWTQQKLSVLSGLPQVVISRFDSQGGYSMNTLVRLSRVFDCSIEDLFEIKEKVPRENTGALPENDDDTDQGQ